MHRVEIPLGVGVEVVGERRQRVVARLDGPHHLVEGTYDVANLVGHLAHAWIFLGDHFRDVGDARQPCADVVMDVMGDPSAFRRQHVALPRGQELSPDTAEVDGTHDEKYREQQEYARADNERRRLVEVLRDAELEYGWRT